jgi:hypothetical protein
METNILSNMKHYFIEVQVTGDDEFDENYRFIVEGKNKKEAETEAIIKSLNSSIEDECHNPSIIITECYETSAEASVD